MNKDMSLDIYSAWSVIHITQCEGKGINHMWAFDSHLDLRRLRVGV